MIMIKGNAIINKVQLLGNKNNKRKQQIQRCLYICMYLKRKYIDRNLTIRYIHLDLYCLCHVGSRFDTILCHRQLYCHA